MAARRAAPPAPPALTDGDVDLLRQRLAAGEAPRVVIRAASAAVPAGTRGTVVRLGDPASQDEYVVVRIKSDEVPFSPSELSLPGAKARPAPAPAPAPKPKPAPRKRTKAAAPAAVAPSQTTSSSQTATAARPASSAQSASRTRTAGGRRSSRRSKQRKLAALTVTLCFDGDDWSAEATRGARRLARSAPLRPGAVGALAEHVDDETLRTALVETVEACRAVVEERAARLRAELHDTEAALRDYETRPKRR